MVHDCSRGPRDLNFLQEIARLACGACQSAECCGFAGVIPRTLLASHQDAAHLRDVHPQGAVDAAAGEADEDAKVDACPRGVARGAVGAVPVALQLDELREHLLVPLIFLLTHGTLGVHGGGCVRAEFAARRREPYAMQSGACAVRDGMIEEDERPPSR